MRHVILTGEVGIGKSTVLERTLNLLNVRTEGMWTGADAPRDAHEKTLYMRAYGDEATGCLFARLPGADRAYAARCFDTVGVRLLRRARRLGELIVIDELGWLERGACQYQQELLAAFDGDVPVLAVLRQNRAEWADWIRKRPDAELLTVCRDNRDDMPELAAGILRQQIQRRDPACLKEEEPLHYALGV